MAPSEPRVNLQAGGGVWLSSRPLTHSPSFAPAHSQKCYVELASLITKAELSFGRQLIVTRNIDQDRDTNRG